MLRHKAITKKVRFLVNIFDLVRNVISFNVTEKQKMKNWNLTVPKVVMHLMKIIIVNTNT